MSVVEVPAAKTTSVHQQIGIRLWLGVVTISFSFKTCAKSLCERVIKPYSALLIGCLNLRSVDQ